MQKHERMCLERIRQTLEPLGFRVWTETSRAKVHVWVDNGTVRAKKTLSSSPKDIETEIRHAERWAVRVSRGDVRRG